MGVNTQMREPAPRSRGEACAVRRLGETPPPSVRHRRLPARGPEIGLQLSRFVLEQRADDLGRPLTGREDEGAGQIEGRVLLVRAGLIFERLLALAVDDAANSRPID